MSSSRYAIIDALDALDAAVTGVAALPFHTLTRAEVLEVLDRLAAHEKRLAGLQQRLLGQLAAQAAPRGSALAETLARRLRISPAEAQRRLAEATRLAS
jgi:hypothetical protein